MTIMITIVLSLLLYYIIICTEAVILAHKSSCVRNISLYNVSPPTALTHYFLRRLGLAFSPWGKPDLKSSSQQGLQGHLFLPLPWGHTGYGAAWDMSQERERDLSH